MQRRTIENGARATQSYESIVAAAAERAVAQVTPRACGYGTSGAWRRERQSLGDRGELDYLLLTGVQEEGCREQYTSLAI